MTAARILLPPKLVPVFTGEAMYRGAYGGRGSAKTRSFAKMTAVRALMWASEGREGIILCGREFMNSLADSSLAEVKAAISSEPWLAAFFDVGETYVRTKCGRIPTFSPASGNLDSIKSRAREGAYPAEETHEEVSYFRGRRNNHDGRCLCSGGGILCSARLRHEEMHHDKKPTTTTSVVVGDGKVFKTRTEAETGMKTIKVCEH